MGLFDIFKGGGGGGGNSAALMYQSQMAQAQALDRQTEAIKAEQAAQAKRYADMQATVKALSGQFKTDSETGNQSYIDAIKNYSDIFKTSANDLSNSYKNSATGAITGYQGSSNQAINSYGDAAKNSLDSYLANQKSNIADYSKIGTDLLGAYNTNTNSYIGGYENKLRALSDLYNSRVTSEDNLYNTRIDRYGNRVDELGKNALNEQLLAAQRAVDMNAANVGTFNSEAMQMSDSALQTRMAMLDVANPGWKSLLAQGNANAADMQSGIIPADVQANLARTAGFRSMASGVRGGSGLGRNLYARDLGLTSMDLMDKGAKQAVDLANTQKGLVNLDSLQVNPSSIYSLNRVDPSKAMDAAALGTTTRAAGYKGVLDAQGISYNGLLDSYKTDYTTMATGLSNILNSGMTQQGSLLTGGLDVAGKTLNTSSDMYGNLLNGQLTSSGTLLNAGLDVGKTALAGNLSVSGNLYNTQSATNNTLLGTQTAAQSNLYSGINQQNAALYSTQSGAAVSGTNALQQTGMQSLGMLNNAYTNYADSIGNINNQYILNQQAAQRDQNSYNSSIWSTIGGLAGTIIGSVYGGPIGGAAGGALGSAAGRSVSR